jgi:hypothetical protein
VKDKIHLTRRNQVAPQPGQNTRGRSFKTDLGLLRPAKDNPLKWAPNRIENRSVFRLLLWNCLASHRRACLTDKINIFVAKRGFDAGPQVTGGIFLHPDFLLPSSA